MKELIFENGTPRDATDDCPHDDVVDRPGANPFCRQCGEINPEDGTDRTREQLQEAYE